MIARIRLASTKDVGGGQEVSTSLILATSFRNGSSAIPSSPLRPRHLKRITPGFLSNFSALIQLSRPLFVKIPSSNPVARRFLVSDRTQLSPMLGRLRLLSRRPCSSYDLFQGWVVLRRLPSGLFGISRRDKYQREKTRNMGVFETFEN